jgi:cathepsin B
MAGKDVILSPEDLVACDTSDMGCNGGWLNNAWEYLQDTGAVSDGCFGYTSGTGNVPHCQHGACDDTQVPYVKYTCSKGSIVEGTSVEAIKTEIYNHGPVETAFDVYEDFFNYAGGIYQHLSGGLEGGHAVKMLGWGNENGEDYWLCANSWGPAWGESGFFRIKMGDCGIDDAIYACTPNTSSQFHF